MALDFPSSPALNDTYQIGNKTWKWNGEAWQLQGEFYNVGGVYDHANGAFDLANGTATIANTDVTNVSVSSGTYGNSTAIPSLTIAANGRITSITTASAELVNDTTPQLGGNLDLNGNDITGTGDIDISGDVAIAGNLTVTGETTYANTTTVNLGDNIITLNADIPQDSAPSENAGLEIDRGTSDNVSLLWNETDDEWTFTNDGSTYYPIASADRLDSAYAHANGAFDAANTNASSITTTNNRLDNAYFHANSAFDKANTAITTSGGTITGNLTVTQNLSVGNISLTGTANVPSLITSDTLTIGSQVIYTQGTNGFSVNEDFDPSANSTQTAYHFTSGAGRETVAFTLARTAQFTDGFGIYGTSSDNKFVMFGEQNNTSWEWRKGVGIRPLDLDGGTLVANLSSTGNLTTIGTISAPGFFDDGVDVKGHAEAAFSLANGTAGIANTDVTNISISADTYGNSTAIPSVTVEANGRVSAITTTSISIPETYNDANVVSLLSSFGSNTITTTGDISVGNLSTSGTINVASAFTFPTVDGSADQVLVTDGSGTLTWTDQSGGSANATVDVFTTTANGATASFDLGFEPSGGLAIVATIDGVSQANSTNYTISGSTITFTSTPDANSVIYVTGFTNVTPIGPASVTLSNVSATGDGSTTQFNLGFTPPSGDQYLTVSIDGILQTPTTHYSVNATGQTITFGEPPANTANIYIASYYTNTDQYITVPTSVDVTSFNTTSNGLVSSFDVGFAPINEKSLIVSLDGILQQPNSAYTVSGNTITFSETPADTVNVVVTSMYTNVSTVEFNNEQTAKLTSSYTHANAAFDAANTAQTTADGAYAHANGAFDAANTAQTTADAAFEAANTKFASSGGTISGDTTITGNLVTTGTMNAASYIGDASSLTNISAANLTGSIDVARMPTGSILKVQHHVVTTNYTGTSSSNVDFPAWSFSFTPQLATSKVFVMISVGINFICDGVVYLKRNGTIVKNNWFGSSRNDDQYDYPQASAFYLDSPATSSAITYQVGGRATGCTNIIRFGGSDNHASITFMEVAG